MKKNICLSLFLLVISLSVMSQNPPLPNKDSTFTWNHNFNTLSFREKIASTDNDQFIILSKGDNGNHYISLLNNKLSYIYNKKIEIDDLSNPVTLFYLGDIIYIGDNLNNQASIYKYSLSNAFTTNFDGRNNPIILPNVKEVHKIEVYDSSNVKIIVGIGKDINNVSCLFKYYTYNYNKINHQVNYSLYNAAINENFIDFSVTDNKIVVLSNMNTNTNNSMSLRYFNKFGNFSYSDNKVYLLSSNINHSLTGRLTKTINDNIAFGISIINHTSEKVEYCIGTFSNTNNLINIKHNTSYYKDGEIIDIDYFEKFNDSYLYVAIGNRIVKLNLTSDFDITNSFKVLNFNNDILLDGVIIPDNDFIITSHRNSIFVKSSFYFDTRNFSGCDFVNSLLFNNIYPYQQTGIGGSSIIHTNGFENNLLSLVYNIPIYEYTYNLSCYAAFDPNNPPFDPKPPVFKSISKTGLDINIYPNPAKDEVIIASSIEMNKVEIYNMVGQKVYESNAGGISARVNVANFNTGSYVAKIYTEAGIATKKIIVE